jgi:hypothetical protein
MHSASLQHHFRFDSLIAFIYNVTCDVRDEESIALFARPAPASWRGIGTQLSVNELINLP